MDAMETWEKLAAAARRERPPGIDVSGKVLRSLRAHEAERENHFSGTLARFSAVSCAAAVVLGAVALHAWLTMHDPMIRLFETVAMVMK